jgi:hypothetical protein
MACETGEIEEQACSPPGRESWRIDLKRKLPLERDQVRAPKRKELISKSLG